MFGTRAAGSSGIGLAQFVLRFLPLGLCTICFLQIALHEYFLSRENFEVLNITITGNDALLAPFPNALFLLVPQSGASSGQLFFIAGAFFLVLAPLALLCGKMLAGFSIERFRTLTAYAAYILISWASYYTVVRMVFARWLMQK